MAAIDYDVLSEGPLCTIGYLAQAVSTNETTIEVTGLQFVDGFETDLRPGMGVLINDEIVRLDDVNLPYMTISRGCADTIPATLHAAGSLIWFFDNDTGTDGRAYTAASTIGVKLLPQTASGGAVPLERAPALPLTFNWRFIRPYPPAKFKCEGLAWHVGPFEINSTNWGITFTWVERNRLVQADQLVGHAEDGIAAEVGTTYVARVYDASDTLLRTFSGITGTSWTYDFSDAQTDMPGRIGYVVIHAVRDTFDSWQGYRTDVTVKGVGLGEALGLNLGGAPI